MAGGKQHWGLSSALVIVGTPLAFYFLDKPIAGAITAGLVIGKYATCDVRDQEHVKNYAERRFAKNYGKVLGLLFWAYWWPLAKLIPHRSFLSHLPLVGTSIAFLYLFAPPLSVWWYLVGMPVGLSEWLVGWLYNWLGAGILIGWAVQDFGHLAQDGFKLHWGKR